MNQEFWFKNTDEIRNYFLEEINQNELISKKHKKVCTTLTHITHFIFSTTIASTITGCTSISVFVSLLGVPIRITSSQMGWKICAIATGIINFQSITRKNKSRYDKTVLLAKFSEHRSLNFWDFNRVSFSSWWIYFNK